jgi:hypothetical protein
MERVIANVAKWFDWCWTDAGHAERLQGVAVRPLKNNQTK